MRSIIKQSAQTTNRRWLISGLRLISVAELASHLKLTSAKK